MAESCFFSVGIGINNMFYQFLLHPPFSDKGGFSWRAGVCAVIWDIWGERNARVFRGRERRDSEIWSLVRFHVSLGFGFKELL